MNDPVQWLLTQFDEDARVAQAARDTEFCNDGRWVLKGPFEENLGSVHSEAGEAILGEEESVPFARATHIVRHAPARTLRDVEAYRQLLAVHRRYVPEDDQACLGCAGGIMWTSCPVVRIVAAVYSNRPGYAEAVAALG
jgi:hypothetical protein